MSLLTGQLYPRQHGPAGRSLFSRKSGGWWRKTRAAEGSISAADADTLVPCQR